MNKRISATEVRFFNLDLRTGNDEVIDLSFESNVINFSEKNDAPAPPRPDSTSPFASVDIKQIQALATLLNFHNDYAIKPFPYQQKPKKDDTQHPC